MVWAGVGTHKAIIRKKKLTDNKSTSQIAQEIDHTPQAVDRYLKGLSQVVFCTQRGMSIKNISFVTSMSNRLVKQYAKLPKTLKPADRGSLKQAVHGEQT